MKKMNETEYDDAFLAFGKYSKKLNEIKSKIIKPASFHQELYKDSMWYKHRAFETEREIRIIANIDKWENYKDSTRYILDEKKGNIENVWNLSWEIKRD